MMTRFYNILTYCTLVVLTLGSGSIVFAQGELNKLKVAVEEKDCKQIEKLVGKLDRKITSEDSLYADFKKLLVKAYGARVCKDNDKEIYHRQSLLQYYEETAPNPEEVAKQSYFISNRFFTKGEYDSASHYARKSAEIFSTEYGEDNIWYTRALNTLGNSYFRNGEYTSARKTLQEAKRIKEKVEVFDIQYARILNILGAVYTRIYRYEEAEDCLNRSAAVKFKEKGKDVSYGQTLYYDAVLFQSLGDRYNIERALDTIEQAIQIRKKVNQDLYYYNYLTLKAQLLMDLDSTEASIRLFNQVLQDYYDELTEKDNTIKENISIIYHSLGRAWLRLDDPQKAREFSEKALQEMAEANGTEHPKYALELRDHADLLFEITRSDTLNRLYERSSNIIGKRYKRGNYEYYLSQHAYFLYLVRSGQHDEAIGMYKQLGDFLEDHVVEISRYLSISELGELSETYREYFHALLTLAVLHRDDEELQIYAANAALFYKGYILENVIKDKRSIKRFGELTEIAEEIREKRLELSDLQKKSEPDGKRIKSLEDEIASLETQFSRKSNDKGYEYVDWEKISFDALSSDEAAIEFIRVKTEASEDPRYVAIIFHPDQDLPVIVDLFRESSITEPLKEGRVNSEILYQEFYDDQDNRSISPGKVDKGISLYHLIWKKLLPHLDGVDHIYYAPDGLLHAVAFHAIKLDERNYAGQVYSLVQMTSLRNLNYEEGTARSYDDSKTAYLMGGLEYGGDDVAVLRGSGSRWSYLTYSVDEVDTIAAYMERSGFEVELMKASQPTFDRVWEYLGRSPSPRFLHFATHGSFQSDDLLGIRKGQDPGSSLMDLARSGLVLANANDIPDGRAVLSAADISELDLEDTELVVLSGCETGLGKLYEQEGVYGLQRAFRITGVKYMIVSLWSVVDPVTNSFMQTFYKHLILQDQRVEDAFYATQMEFIKQGRTPKDWAGFVLIR